MFSNVLRSSATSQGSSGRSGMAWRTWMRHGLGVLALLLTAAPPAGWAIDPAPGLTGIAISSAPVDTLFGAAPNLLLTLDDSRSMNAAFLPDDIWVPGTVYTSSEPAFGPRDTSHLTNLQYYNPAVVYLPPVGADGSSMDHAEFNGAWVDPLHRAWAESSACTPQTSRTGSCSQDYSEDSCRLDLRGNYAAAWNLTNSHQAPCADLDPAVSIGGNPIASASQLYTYTIDSGNPDWPAFIDYANRQRPRWSASRIGQEWAFRCLRNIDTGISLQCPAFYHKFRSNGTYQDALGVTRNCADLDLRATRAADFPEACLVRVEVGTAETILDLDQHDITANVIAKRRALLQMSGELLSDSALARRNFANWFSYYRTRFLSVQTVLSRVMNLSVRPRIAYQGLTLGEYSPDDAAYKTLAATFAPYDATARQAFYDWLFGRRADASTFLVSAALRAHHFCQSDQAYLEHPAAVLNNGQLTLVTPPNSISNPILGCRNNFHVIFTDGFWEDDGYMTRASPPPIGKFIPPAWLANNDGVAHVLPPPGAQNAALGVPTDYDPGRALSFMFQDSEGMTREGTTNVYADSNSGMLADVTFQSWIEDLRPSGLAGGDDVVPPLLNTTTGTIDSQFWNPNNDLADWQHITTFTVGFGVAGNTAYPSGAWSWRSPQDILSTGNLFTDGFPGAWNAIDSATTAPDYASPYSVSRMKIDDTWHAGINGRGGYHSLADPERLIQSLSAALGAVAGTASAATAGPIAAATTDMTGSELIIQARFNSADWSGDLRSYQVSRGGGRPPCPQVSIAGEPCQDPVQAEYYRSAAQSLYEQAASGLPRRVFTAGASGVPIVFSGSNWDRLADTQKRDFLLGLGYSGDPALAPTATIAGAKALLDYVAGDRTYEASGQTYQFRSRSSVLGDVINAPPVIVGRPVNSYKAPGYQRAASAGGMAFKSLQAGRTPMVYAGANDGMLHAFRLDDLSESFAFVPSLLMGLEGDPRDAAERPGLHRLGDPAYGSSTVGHRSYVDGAIAAGDVRFGPAAQGDWHTVLIGGLGLGAQGLYALDVTSPPDAGASPESFAGRLSLWEIGDRVNPAFPADTNAEHWDPNLGYVFARPAIGRIPGASIGADPVWVAVLGNGYNSAENDGSRAAGCDDVTKDVPNSGDPSDDHALCGQAMLYVIDIAHGTFLRKIGTGVGRRDDPLHPEATDAGNRRPNALGQAILVERRVHTDGDPLADIAYAADLFGTVWRFDLTGQSAMPVRRLFSAVSPDDPIRPQPITAPMAVARHPTGRGRLVLFGTGQYLSLDDASDRQVQSVYAIWDRDDDNQPSVQRSDLLQQSFLQTDIVVTGTDGAAVSRARTSTAAAIDWGTRLGWYIDLDIEQESGVNRGERVIAEPRVEGTRVTFVSLVPKNNPCASGGYSWINTLDLRSGAAFKSPTFDQNQDGSISLGDLVNSAYGPKASSSMHLITPDGRPAAGFIGGQRGLLVTGPADLRRAFNMPQ